MTVSYTPEVRAKLEDYLATHELPQGLGNEESACSIAAINLALSGELTDDIPDCMSEVLGRATIGLQDAMPDDMRNSDRYKAWLPTAAGTGRDHEQERLAVLMDWMWGTVLPKLQGLADENGFGKEWRRMCEERAQEAARAAAYAAYTIAADSSVAVARAAAYAAAYAAEVADSPVAARAAEVADSPVAARAAAYAAEVAEAAAANAADDAAVAADASARAADADFWQTVDPISVLERMTKIGQKK